MGPLGLSLVGQRSLRWRVEIKKHRGSDLGGLSAHLNREGPEQWRSGPSLFPVPKGVTFSETSTEFFLGKTVTCIRNRHMYPKPSHVSETVTCIRNRHTFGCGSHVWVRVTRLGVSGRRHPTSSTSPTGSTGRFGEHVNPAARSATTSRTRPRGPRVRRGYRAPRGRHQS